MNGVADVDEFKICIQVCMWLGFPPLIYYQLPIVFSPYDSYIRVRDRLLTPVNEVA